MQVSGEEDDVRLRILADAHTFKVGDTAAVQIHWREEPALALVTFQGARVLDYRLVELKKGANELAIPMTAQLAPNFELAVAVMTDPRPDWERRRGREGREGGAAADAVAGSSTEQGRDAESGSKVPHAKRADRAVPRATSPFTVERDLRVKIATKRKASPQRLARRARGRRPARRRARSDGHDHRSAGQAGGGRGEPGDDRAVALGAVRLAAAGDPGLLPRRPRAVGRPQHVEHHLRLPARHAADQPAAAGREGPRGDRQGGRRKPAGGDCARPDARPRKSRDRRLADANGTVGVMARESTAMPDVVGR